MFKTHFTIPSENIYLSKCLISKKNYKNQKFIKLRNNNNIPYKLLDVLIMNIILLDNFFIAVNPRNYMGSCLSVTDIHSHKPNICKIDLRQWI